MTQFVCQVSTHLYCSASKNFIGLEDNPWVNELMLSLRFWTLLCKSPWMALRGALGRVWFTKSELAPVPLDLVG